MPVFITPLSSAIAAQDKLYKNPTSEVVPYGTFLEEKNKLSDDTEIVMTDNFVVSLPPTTIREGREEVDIDGDVTPPYYDDYWESQHPPSPILQDAPPLFYQNRHLILYEDFAVCIVVQLLH